MLSKVKVQRWRGAVWTDEDLPWLIAAGQREDGSPDDFYSALETTARAARARYNADNRQPLSTTTYVGQPTIGVLAGVAGAATGALALFAR